MQRRRTTTPSSLLRNSAPSIRNSTLTPYCARGKRSQLVDLLPLSMHNLQEVQTDVFKRTLSFQSRSENLHLLFHGLPVAAVRFKRHSCARVFPYHIQHVLKRNVLWPSTTNHYYTGWCWSLAPGRWRFVWLHGWFALVDDVVGSKRTSFVLTTHTHYSYENFR